MDFESIVAAGTPATVHSPGTNPLWGESWYFDFTSVDGSTGGFVRVGDYPNLGRRWSWAYVVAGHRAIGRAVDHVLPGDRDAPWQTTDPSLRLTVAPIAEGWHLTADGEGFWMDVTWRPQADAYAYTRGRRVEQPGWVTGEVRTGGESLPVDGPGQRDHSWGVRDWWRFGWTWCAGRLLDGTRYQATVLDARGRVAPDGYVMAPGRTPEAVRCVVADSDAVRLDHTLLRFTDVAEVTIDLPAPDGGMSRLRRAMTRVRTHSGERGVGWRERNLPEPRS